MDIPAIYSVFKNGEVTAAPVKIDGTDISFESEPAKPAFSAKDDDDRMPVVVVDVKGFGKRKMDDRLLTNMKFPGNDIWFMTNIKDIEDVIDGFMGNIMKLLVPCHTVRNDLVLKETFEVSEDCIPVLFVSQGRARYTEDRTKDVRTAVEELARTGFCDIAVFDTDSMLRADDWAALHDRYQDLIPFVRKKDRETDGIGFQRIICDL
ncbi:MAG: hypothetical protein LBP82_04230 [Candidatus Methanoplasma sp.]|jgi:hypothetical protein|nr:hypothetical protein [Candidatus Methanoplasma sp.]